MKPFARYCVFVTCLLFASSFSAKAKIEITDSHGKYRFAEPPKRVVVLNWALAEQMLELGITPVGMADIKGFNRHANAPVVPNTVLDVGARLSPDMRQIEALKPEIIVIGYSQRPLIRPLSNIATVIYFKNFGKRYNNQEKSEERFLEVAKLFDKTELAKQKLLEREQKLSELREQLLEMYDSKSLPDVQLVVPQSASIGQQQWVFSENSMPYYAAKALGLNIQSFDNADKFGVAKVSEKDRYNMDSGKQQSVCYLYFTSYANTTMADKTEECAYTLDYQNAFGGVMSIQYLAESISRALIKHQQVSH